MAKPGFKGNSGDFAGERLCSGLRHEFFAQHVTSFYERSCMTSIAARASNRRGAVAVRFPVFSPAIKHATTRLAQQLRYFAAASDALSLAGDSDVAALGATPNSARGSLVA